ncbi:MAG: L-serine ammonia-lyase [Chlamydiota bacterium]
MSISTFELFSIGIGPSSSHTVGPLRAARQFVSDVELERLMEEVASIKVDLYGSLALTGKGHATDVAIILGLQGMSAETVDPNRVEGNIEAVRQTQTLSLLSVKNIPFREEEHLLFHREKTLPYHPNGMKFTIYGKDGKELLVKTYYSVGGGFVVDHDHVKENESVVPHEQKVPFPFETASDIIGLCYQHNLSLDQLMMENEKAFRDETEVVSGLLNIWKVMDECIDRGCQEEGVLPGGLQVKRRAKSIKDQLLQHQKDGEVKPTDFMEWVSLWALAVNEENAAGGRVVTAPTNGSAGVIPAVIKYYVEMIENSTEEGIVKFMLVAGAIGILYKTRASISAAEMGCMGEVGVACSMAAGGLTAAMGGSIEQIENAAEIGMEHNLGLTCDPIMGLVQVPCIERNTMGAIKAINASLLALRGDGCHRVTLDQVIDTMRQTGHDMMSIYKETSMGGLAVNVPEC